MYPTKPIIHTPMIKRVTFKELSQKSFKTSFFVTPIAVTMAIQVRDDALININMSLVVIIEIQIDKLFIASGKNTKMKSRYPQDKSQRLIISIETKHVE